MPNIKHGFQIGGGSGVDAVQTPAEWGVVEQRLH